MAGLLRLFQLNFVSSGRKSLSSSSFRGFAFLFFKESFFFSSSPILTFLGFELNIITSVLGEGDAEDEEGGDDDDEEEEDDDDEEEEEEEEEDDEEDKDGRSLITSPSFLPRVVAAL